MNLKCHWQCSELNKEVPVNKEVNKELEVNKEVPVNKEVNKELK